ncbi:hypothetical protein NQ318_018115 [Aromia moschata]|uniref:DUF4817 domain-containing protein n=1 Tax=Aromia moschata TaxID=1265417 RepID=A0AAV8ZFI7_9CUCU|nr:hypothetical protein NQ318_018115 [Aromia moschata]
MFNSYLSIRRIGVINIRRVDNGYRLANFVKFRYIYTVWSCSREHFEKYSLKSSRKRKSIKKDDDEEKEEVESEDACCLHSKFFRIFVSKNISEQIGTSAQLIGAALRPRPQSRVFSSTIPELASRLNFPCEDSLSNKNILVDLVMPESAAWRRHRKHNQENRSRLDIERFKSMTTHIIERFLFAYRIKIAHLNETDRIQILMLIWYDDRSRSHSKVCTLFNEAHPERPIVRSTVTKIVAKFQAAGHVRDLPKSGRPPVPENTQLDVMLQVQDNPHSATRQMGIDFNLSYTSVRNIIHEQKFHPYKITLMQELSEFKFDNQFTWQISKKILGKCRKDPEKVNMASIKQIAYLPKYVILVLLQKGSALLYVKQ